ncbi:HlyD family secretion protein [Chitinophaga tropicalis]|uniref:HlyD family efflux transporter periplasmic adaptor subunit n=1 Tax=Chitinophaga tropicalis TaxID=2683588 RepID=A0A7K1U4S1_9BACT|nr:HlyD family secretion protein [Chitinophaga tropicalis]MVT09357.1 HlyD family efflux transporter periplasmic adaptor subunit [Chitinophaga tropicalis]
METKPKRKPIRLIILALIILGAGGYAFNSYLRSKQIETTDNAQLDGDLLPVRAGIAGYVESIRFKDNQQVKQGDTLIVFDTHELSARVQQAEAALAKAKADILVSGSKAAAGMNNAQAALLASQSDQQLVIAAKASLDKAVQDLKRTESLLKIKAATQEQYETALNKVELAKADHERAMRMQQSSLSSSEGLKTEARAQQGQISVAQAEVQQREAELAEAKEHLSHSYIIAPYTGIVTKRTIQVGQYISTGQSLCAIIDNHHLWVTANFKETQLKQIHVGQEAEITIDAYPGIKLKGKIESFGGATGAKFALIPPDNATGNFIKIAQRFPLRISVDEIPAKEKLYPGLSAFVTVKIN